MLKYGVDDVRVVGGRAGLVQVDQWRVERVCVEHERLFRLSSLEQKEELVDEAADDDEDEEDLF
ncbi:hypothetical protein BpHYR1_052844 [Brachionus plicatilis]|uniref:Uncharacterized protein n=1 Tax=Brachionus plicatilis TaxID=10195 RepID=A0A3M7RIM3_BRAPC|nr:hypothetical protein BpHYR1_052844 [Brachionus plicatilis]